MKKNFFVLICLIFSILPDGFSQSLRQPISAIYTGLGAYSTRYRDAFSFVNHQAALAQAKNITAGVYGEQRFLLKATSLYAAAFTLPSKMGNFGVDLKYLGFKNFNEKQIGLAYARSLGAKVDIGVQFNYYGYQVPSYSKVSTINFEIGAIIHLTEQVNLGVHAYNPVGGNLGGMDERLTTAYKVGLGYDASESFFVAAELVKEEDYPINLNAGIQYQFARQFFARAGLSSATSAAYAGVGIGWNNLRLDISASYHPQLGWSPGLLLIFNGPLSNGIPGPLIAPF